MLFVPQNIINLIRKQLFRICVACNNNKIMSKEIPSIKDKTHRHELLEKKKHVGISNVSELFLYNIMIVYHHFKSRNCYYRNKQRSWLISYLPTHLPTYTYNNYNYCLLYRDQQQKCKN